MGHCLHTLSPSPCLPPLSLSPSSLMEATSQAITPQDIQVTLLLAGGHQYTLSLKSDSSVLLNLLKAVAAQVQPSSTNLSTLFQIPVEGQKQALWFASHQLVGILTEPPIYLQQQPLQPQQQLVIAQPQTSISQPNIPSPSPQTIPSRFIHLDNFLSPSETHRLVKYVLKHEQEFVSTSTSTGADNYRRSSVLYSFPEFEALIRKRIREVTPKVLEQLGIAQFNPSDIECQLTAHNNGNFYKIHNDNGSPDTNTRELTYVYYFHRQPKNFTGGELRIYDSTVKNRYLVAAETYHDVEPRHNSIVFFASRYMHEVLEIHCPSRKFADSRFTINGWVRR